MKKTLLVLLTIVFAFNLNTKAEDFSAVYNGDTIYYNITSSVFHFTASVTFKGIDLYSYSNEYKESIIIPDSVFYNANYYLVTSIDDYTFSGCDSLTSINIPNSITKIGNAAFGNCAGLTSIIIPNSVMSIGNQVFSQCINLTSITIPNSVTSIGDSFFAFCVGLTSVNIPNSVTSIGDWVFNGCTGLTSITIPNSVTSIGRGAFWECSSLKSIILPNSVTSIENSAFHDCSSLSSITIPSSVTSIGSSAFENTPWYNSKPDGLIYINNVLYSYKGIMPENTTINIQEGTKSIVGLAFSGCSGLTSITIPNSVTSIGANTFMDCNRLTWIIIPDSVTNIGSGLFWGCSELISVQIPNSVTLIKDMAFFYCDKLTSITIPSNVDSIAFLAFSNCTGLTSITCLAVTPPSLGFDVFLNVDKSIPLYVPTASIPLYQAADQWQDFNILPLALDDIESDKNIEVLIYPNPAKDKAKIRIDNLNSKADFIVLDILGKEVKRDVIAKGTNELELNISDLPKGIYNILIVNESINQTKKLIIVK
ncbi:MAG: hypothetical protein H6Q16_1184 [Bacteroidetes bacterium]|nr:hypothetical protein [Bacteroidota bacterium]